MRWACVFELLKLVTWGVKSRVGKWIRESEALYVSQVLKLQEVNILIFFLERIYNVILLWALLINDSDLITTFIHHEPFDHYLSVFKEIYDMMKTKINESSTVSGFHFISQSHMYMYVLKDYIPKSFRTIRISEVFGSNT